MPKPLELTADILTTPPVPKAAQSAGEPARKPVRQAKAAPEGEPRVPFQVRWPRADVKAAKLATLNLDFPSESDFMLACFHAYMQNRNGMK